MRDNARACFVRSIKIRKVENWPDIKIGLRV